MENTRFGKYTLDSHLGAGATADVYKAWDTQLNRWVAIKVLKAALMADRAAFERFRKEAATAANLFHDNIATVLDMGEENGHFFIVMKFIEGVSLDKAIQTQPLTWEQALRLAAQVGSALDFAHKKGFLHRDVKPGNIMLTPEGDFVLTDFGLTRAAQSSGLTASTGIIVGTPAYVPPEVWNGAKTTPAADQYALACVLVEALTGRAAFWGDTPEAILTRHLISGPDLPSAWPAGVPGGAGPALRRALEKDPDRRYESCARLAEALSQASARPALRSQRTLPGWGLALLALLILGGLGYAVLSQMGTGPSIPATQTPPAIGMNATVPPKAGETPAPPASQTAVPTTAAPSPTQTPPPTSTPTASFTPSFTPTRSFTPSFTPSPTRTLTFTPTITFTPTPKPVPEFLDPFDGGMKPDWSFDSPDQWATSNGQLVSLKYDARLWIGNESWQNYLVEFDLVKINESDSCTLSVHYTEKSKKGFEIIFHAKTTAYGDYISPNLLWPQIPNTKWEFSEFPLKIRVTAQGSLITTYANDKQVNQANLTLYQKGMIVLYCDFPGSTFDNFKIAPLP